MSLSDWKPLKPLQLDPESIVSLSVLNDILEERLKPYVETLEALGRRIAQLEDQMQRATITGA